MNSLIEYLRDKKKKEGTMEKTNTPVSEVELAQVLGKLSTDLEGFKAGLKDLGQTVSNLEQAAGDLTQRVGELEEAKAESPGAKANISTEQVQPDFFDRFEAGELTDEEKEKMDNIIVPDVLRKAAIAKVGIEQFAPESVSPDKSEGVSPDFDPTKPYIEFHEEAFEGAEYNEGRKRYEKLVMPK